MLCDDVCCIEIGQMDWWEEGYEDNCMGFWMPSIHHV